MPTALRPPRMTIAEFLGWEAAQELRWEFDGFGLDAFRDLRRAETVEAELIGV